MQELGCRKHQTSCISFVRVTIIYSEEYVMGEKSSFQEQYDQYVSTRHLTLPAGTYDHTGPVKIDYHPADIRAPSFPSAMDQFRQTFYQELYKKEYEAFLNNHIHITYQKEVSTEVAMAHEAEPVAPRKPVCGHCHERKASRAVDAFNAYKHNEKDACCAIEDTLKDAAEDEMRAEIKRNLREWPICKVSGEPVDVIFHWDEEKDNLLIAEFHCHECYELSDYDT